MKYQQIIDAFVNLLKDGFSWQETIITVVGLAAIVLIVLILAMSVTKISITLIGLFQTLFSGMFTFVHKVGRSLKTLLATKPD